MSIRMRVLPRFPAMISGISGITTSRDGTDIIIKSDYGSLVRIPAVDNQATTFFKVWNADNDSYSIMTFEDVFAAVVDIADLMAKGTYDPTGKNADAFNRANHYGYAKDTLYVRGETVPGVDLATFGYGVGPTVHGYGASGTIASPAAMPATGFIFGLGGRPHTGTAFAEHATAALHFIARENITPTAQGSSLKFLITPLGVTTTGDGSNRKTVFQLESDSSTTGTRFRFTGNGSIAQRMYFQSVDTSAVTTSLGVIPPVDDANASGAYNAFAKVDPANSPFGQLNATPTAIKVSSDITGSASYVPLSLWTAGAERMRFETTGYGFIGTTSLLSSSSSVSMLTIRNVVGTASSLRLEGNTASSTTLAAFVNTNGIVGSIGVSGSATTYATSSDRRRKDNIELIDNSGDLIDALTPVSFTWKGTADQGHGVIAQDAYQVFPEAVVPGDNDGGLSPDDEAFQPWAVDYSKFVPLLLAEVKALRERVASLETRP